MNRKTSVWAAASRGDLDGVKAAVENGRDIEERGEWDSAVGTGLHHACYKGYFSIAEYLIESGAEVNSRNKYGSLPIHLACVYGNLDIVKLLISRGSDFISTNDNGHTPLHLTSFNRDTSVGDYLMQCIAEAAGNWC